MSNHEEVEKPHDFSTAFERMCSMVAIGKTGSVDETIRELILHCIFYLPTDEFREASDISKSLDSLFGINLLNHELESALTQLIDQHIVQKEDGILVINSSLRDQLQKEIDVTYNLEASVRDNWEVELEDKYPLLDSTKLWNGLRKYLAQTFQRHGIQTVALLDPRIEIASQYGESLSSILNNTVSEFSTEREKTNAKNAISDFMATTGNHPERAKYITQLADGAFTYFTLTIDPEVARNFRENLYPIILFLDTNFLFGILDIEVDPQVAVSKQLMEAIKTHNLPFELRSHPKTIEELLASIKIHEQDLSSRKWSRKISRAAYHSRALSGVELRYHQRYADEGIDVDSFFAPYRHADVLLENMDIHTYPVENDRLQERAELCAEYSEFIKSWGISKSYKLIDHDMTVLDQVRQLRSSATSTLEAGALLVTRDFSLYRFDWETSRNKGKFSSTVLPNIFWQILRPFIPANEEFDKSFAETFAIPEFRIIGSKASEACSKMLNIIAGYKGFPEETARRMLSNDILIQRLQTAENDEVFQQYVEIAIVEQNESLLEEKAQIEARWEEEKRIRKQTEEGLKTETEARQLTEQQVRDLNQRLLEEKAIRSEAEDHSKELAKQLVAEKDKGKKIISLVSFVLVSATTVIVFEILIFSFPWSWLLNHINSVILQIAINLWFVVGIAAIFLKKHRAKIIFSGLFPLATTLIGLLKK